MFRLFPKVCTPTSHGASTWDAHHHRSQMSEVYVIHPGPWDVYDMWPHFIFGRVYLTAVLGKWKIILSKLARILESRPDVAMVAIRINYTIHYYALFSGVFCFLDGPVQIRCITIPLLYISSIFFPHAEDYTRTTSQNTFLRIGGGGQTILWIRLYSFVV